MTIERHLRIGTRGSALALAQTRLVIAALVERWKTLTCDVVVIRTQGDARADVPLAAIGGQGVFAVEIEEALLRGDIDIAIHSAKDLRSTLHDELTFVAFPERADPRDVLVSRDGVSGTIAALPVGARIGTSSPRRDAQMRGLHARLELQSIRGNVDTRLRKLDNGEFDALLLAAAGLDRLGLSSRISQRIPLDVMVPAVGQGAIAVQARADDEVAASLLAPVDHLRTRQAVVAERAFLARLGGGCTAPAGAHSIVHEDGSLTIDAFLAFADGRTRRMHMHGAALDGAQVGITLADQMQAGEMLSFREPSTVHGSTK